MDAAIEVREIRNALSLTVEQFAARLGVAVRTVTRWERGESRPSPVMRRLLVSIAKRRRAGASVRPSLSSRPRT